MSSNLNQAWLARTLADPKTLLNTPAGNGKRVQITKFYDIPDHHKTAMAVCEISDKWHHTVGVFTKKTMNHVKKKHPDKSFSDFNGSVFQIKEYTPRLYDPAAADQGGKPKDQYEMAANRVLDAAAISPKYWVVISKCEILGAIGNKTYGNPKELMTEEKVQLRARQYMDGTRQTKRATTTADAIEPPNKRQKTTNGTSEKKSKRQAILRNAPFVDDMESVYNSSGLWKSVELQMHGVPFMPLHGSKQKESAVTDDADSVVIGSSGPKLQDAQAVMNGMFIKTISIDTDDQQTPSTMEDNGDGMNGSSTVDVDQIPIAGLNVDSWGQDSCAITNSNEDF